LNACLLDVVVATGNRSVVNITQRIVLIYAFGFTMAAKELKALIDVGTSLGYTLDELKQFINDEGMRMDRERKTMRGNDKRRNLNALKKSAWRSRKMKKKKRSN